MSAELAREERESPTFSGLVLIQVETRLNFVFGSVDPLNRP